MNNHAISYIIVGAQGTGKTTFVKNLLDKVSKKALLIYDVNGEYKEYYSYDFIPLQSFLNVAKKVSNSVMVFEEATIFFSSSKSNNEMRELLVRKRHMNNTIILVFHSLRSVPPNIYELCNYITLFKTNDTDYKIDKKFDDERLNEAFKKVRTSENKHENITFRIY